MTVKLLALYKKPKDENAFMTHYETVHMPLVEKVPGLQKTVINRVSASPMGEEPEFFLVAEMHYPNQEIFNVAMKSPENRACGKDLARFAGAGVTLLIANEQD